MTIPGEIRQQPLQYLVQNGAPTCGRLKLSAAFVQRWLQKPQGGIRRAVIKSKLHIATKSDVFNLRWLKGRDYGLLNLMFRVRIKKVPLWQNLFSEI